jgi:succinate dehydrogenase / fumarate reductase iron-sulfur subunit
MRLRRIAIDDQHISDQNNGKRHEDAFTTLIRDNGLLHESELLSRSYGGNSWFGKFAPAAGKELLSSLPVLIRGLITGKFNPKIALFGHKLPKGDLGEVQSIYDKVEGREQRYELNLYISGYDEDESPAEAPVANGAPSAADAVAEPAVADAPVAAAAPVAGTADGADDPAEETSTEGSTSP